MISRWVRTLLLAGAAALAGCAPLREDPGSVGWQALHPAVTIRSFEPWPDSRVHALRVDLRDEGLRLVVSPMNERGLALDAMASGRGALVSVNASFFDREFTPLGVTISQGERWAPVMRAETSALFGCTAAMRCEFHLGPRVQVPADWTVALAGTPWLLRGGRARTESDDAACASLCAQTHPRTAIGLDRSRRYLYILLVEGRRAPIAGLTLAQTAAVLVQLGAHEALNLDGGGSSSLLIAGQSRMARPANEPALRRVANALHVFVGPPP